MNKWGQEPLDDEFLLDHSYSPYNWEGEFRQGYDDIDFYVVSAEAKASGLADCDRMHIGKRQAAKRAQKISEAWARLAVRLAEEAENE